MSRMHTKQAVKKQPSLLFECLCDIFQHVLRWILVFVLLKPMTEFTREEVMRAAAHTLQSARPDFLRVACFLRNIFCLEAAVSDTCILVIHLVFLPFHHRTELGF